jgi:hypothetical protein
VDEHMQRHLEPIHDAITASSQRLTEVDEHMRQHLEPIHDAVTALTVKTEELSQQQARFQLPDGATMGVILFHDKNAKARSTRERRGQTVTAWRRRARLGKAQLGGRPTREVATRKSPPGDGQA